MVMGVLMGLFPLLHIYEMHRCQSSIGQSFVGIVFWELGIATWLIYGILKKDRVIVIANCIAVAVGLLYLLAIRYYALQNSPAHFGFPGKEFLLRP
jgi:uncharacterized protein with PQ loop repeat